VVDDGGAFELGEHAEHLDHHASGGGGGVERFGGGPERDSGGVEVFGDLRQAAEGAGEPVDAVDQQQVEPPRLRLVSARLRAGRSRVAPLMRSEKAATRSQSGWLAMYASRRAVCAFNEYGWCASSVDARV
jgi:hypothetical protein